VSTLKPNLNDQETDTYQESPAFARRVVLVDAAGNIYTASSTTASASSTVTALQGTDPWTVTGTVTANISSLTVTSGLITAQQGTDPWITTTTITDGVTATTKATVAALTNANPLTVAIVDANGDQITSFGGSTSAVTAYQGSPPWTITGSVTANGVDTSLLALESGGNLASIKTNTDNIPASPSTDRTASNAPFSARLSDGTNFYEALTAGDSVVVTSGSVTAQQGTNPWTVTGSVTANIGSLTVTSGTITAQQGTDPWTITGTVTAIPSGTYTITGAVSADQRGTWILGANSGVDIGDVTINNASGASAVNIQDGGNTITVDGTVAVTFTDQKVDLNKVAGESVQVAGGTEAKSIRVTIANDSTGLLSVDDNGGSLTIDGSVTLLPLSSCAAGKTTATTAGTTAVLAGSTSISSVTIKALTSNTGIICIGGSSVTTAAGFQLSPGDAVSLDVDNLADVYLNAFVSGEGVTYIYTT